MRLRALVLTAFLVLFLSAALRHFLFQSTAYDLAIFDQATYLISVGAAPISSFLGYHIMGDHGAPIWYALALPYIVWPSPYWLLLIQALALALGAWPLFAIARSYALPEPEALTLVACYLLYPVVFNANLADFHPETIAVPALFGAVLAARRDQLGRFCACVAIVLSCKSVLGVSVCGMGGWLCLRRQSRFYGVLAVVAGGAWFAFVNLLVVPAITGEDAAAVVGDNRYAYLGASLIEIVTNLALRPWVVVERCLSVSAGGYLLGLAAPLLWGLRLRHSAALLGAVPIVVLNLLSDSRLQRHLTNQYSLPALPFLFLAVVVAMASGQARIRSRRALLIWAAISFAILARYTRLVGYFAGWESLSAQRAAIRMIGRQGEAVVADSCFVSHVSQRSYVDTLVSVKNPSALKPDVHYVLVNLRRPCELSRETAEQFAAQLRGMPDFRVVLERDGVVLFQR